LKAVDSEGAFESESQVLRGQHSASPQ
jgi:hypothetical protein